MSTAGSAGSVVGFAISKAYMALKPSSAIVPEEWMQQFREQRLNTDCTQHKTVVHPIKDDKRTELISVSSTIGDSKADLAKRKVVIYVCGNGEFAAERLPAMRNVFANIRDKTGLPTIDVFCQDYRGKGFNKTVPPEQPKEKLEASKSKTDTINPAAKKPVAKSEPEDHFNKYTLQQDAFDQADLVSNLIKQGYKPENILIIGHSLGSAVANWATNMLIKLNKDNEKINVFLDRGFGDLLRYVEVAWKRLYPNDKTAVDWNNVLLSERGILPRGETFATMAARLPRAVVTRAEGDSVIPEAPSLFALCEKEVADRMQGRLWEMGRRTLNDEGAEITENPHNVNFGDLSINQFFPELKPEHLFEAMLTGKPIKLMEGVQCDAIRLALKGNDRLVWELRSSNYDPWSPETTAKSTIRIDFKENPTADPNAISIPFNEMSGALNSILLKLIKYCNDREKDLNDKAKIAAATGKVLDANTFSTDSIGTKYTTFQKIETASQIIKLLSDPTLANRNALNALLNKPGPHKAWNSALKKIVEEDINPFLKNFPQLIEQHAKRVEAFRKQIDNFNKCFAAPKMQSKSEGDNKAKEGSTQTKAAFFQPADTAASAPATSAAASAAASPVATEPKPSDKNTPPGQSGPG